MIFSLLTWRGQTKKGFVMINRGILLLTMMLWGNALIFARSPEETEAQMDEIKLDRSYVYGESFNDDMNVAYQTALSDLTESVNVLRVDNGKEMLAVSDLQTRVNELKYFKNGRHTVFLYILLTEMFKIGEKTQDGVVSRHGNLPAAQESFAHKLPENVQETLSGQDNWPEIKGILKSYKEDGIIKVTGNVEKLSDVPDDAYSILFDGFGGILAIISPKNSPERINYKNNLRFEESNVTDYKFIVWYK